MAKNWIEVIGRCIYIHIGKITATVPGIYATRSAVKRAAASIAKATGWPVVEE